MRKLKCIQLYSISQFTGFTTDSRLWEVVSMGVHLYLKIGKDEKELVSRRKLLPLLLNIIGICGRAMSKHGDKKSHPVVNVTSEVTMSLEKGLAVLVSHVIGLSLDYDQTSKEERAFVRETSSELVSPQLSLSPVRIFFSLETYQSFTDLILWLLDHAL